MNKTRRFLFTSIGVLVVLCIVCFLWLEMFMTGKSGDAISEIGEIYMSEMSRQLNQKFDAIVNLRLSQMDGIIRRTPPEAVSYGDEMKEELSLSASIRELSYLGLYTRPRGITRRSTGKMWRSLTRLN